MTQKANIPDESKTAPAEAVLTEASPDLGVILDIPVKLSLEVGSTEQTVEQILALAQGTVIELNRKAGDPLDVKVNGTLIAHGEVVESQGKYGIRIIDVVSTSERISKLT